MVKTITRYWSYGLYIVLFFIFLANLLVLIIYPSIPTNYDSDIKLIIAYPNFSFSFNNETGFHQEFFTYVNLDYTKFLNWKLIQSLLCILLILVMVLLYYLPMQKKETEQVNEIEKHEVEEIEDQKQIQKIEKETPKQKEKVNRDTTLDPVSYTHLTLPTN